MNELAELIDLISRLSGADAYRYAKARSSLVGPGNGVTAALQKAVSRAEDDLIPGKLQECLDLLLDESRKRGLAEFIGSDAAYENDEALIAFSTQRLIRNLTGLVATAKVAVAASRVVLQKDQPDVLIRAVEQAVRILRPTDSKPFPGRGGMASVELSGATQLVWKEIKRHEAVDRATGEVLVWSLYWLGELSSLCRPHRSSDEPARFGLLQYLKHRKRGGVAWLAVWRLEESGFCSPLEHPLNALLEFDPESIRTIQSAWRSLSTAVSFCWRIEGTSDGLHDGTSLGAAAHTALRVLLKEDHPFPIDQCAIAGLASDDGMDLQPVKQLEDKLLAAAHDRLRMVIAVKDPDSEYRDQIEQLRKAGVHFHWATSLGEVIRLVTGDSTSSEFDLSKPLLRRYRRSKQVRFPGTQGQVQVWVVEADPSASGWDGQPLPKRVTCIAKLFPFPEKAAAMRDFRTTTWGRELRVLSRVTTSPQAERTLLTLRQGGIDSDQDCFVLLMESSSEGYEPLAQLLDPVIRQRTQVLRLSNIADRKKRRQCWQGVQRLADGLTILHSNRILHRNVCAEQVYSSEDGNPSSYRLGGFEWSWRLGGSWEDPQQAHLPWVVPPEVSEGKLEPASTATDWYGLGMTAIRLLTPLDGAIHPKMSPVEIRMLAEHEVAKASYLEGLERDFLRDMIHLDPSLRPSPGEVRFYLQEILHCLDRAELYYADTPLYAVLPESHQEKFADRLARFGIAPPGGQSWCGSDGHVAWLRDWIREDLARAELFAFPGDNGTRYCLKARLIYSLLPWTQSRGDKGSWRTAALLDRGNFPSEVYATSPVDLGNAKIEVLAPQLDMRRGQPPSGRNWEPILPVPRSLESKEEERKLEMFLRATSQLELIMLGDEIFPYRYNRDSPDYRRLPDGTQRVTVHPDETAVNRHGLWKSQPGMIENFIAEEESGRGTGRVILHSNRTLRTEIDRRGGWSYEVDRERQVMVLTCDDPTAVTPPQNGFLRSDGYYGQIQLLERRQEAIERFCEYGYLTKALTQPRDVWMDTGEPINLDWIERLGTGFEEKRRLIEAILRSQPIFALEGPPGTGKSTLVSRLVQALFDREPGTQILITSQSHGGVDVLREKIEAINDALELPPERQPITVRLGQKTPDGTPNLAGILGTSRKLLSDIAVTFGQQPSVSACGGVWADCVTDLAKQASLQSGDESDADDESDEQEGEAAEVPSVVVSHKTIIHSPSLVAFQELVRMAANVIFATTTARDLKYMADHQQTFDWVIMEEAGRAHGFDMVLPLLAGHRWLFLGDARQLPPYRYDDYRGGLDRLDSAAKLLRNMVDVAGGLVDRKWLDWYDSLSDGERNNFAIFCVSWLKTFERIIEKLKLTPGGKGTKPITEQWRMHPDIGALVSKVFYAGRLTSKTSSAAMSHGLSYTKAFPGLSERAVLWIDFPAVGQPGAQEEIASPRYTRPVEVSIIQHFLQRVRIPQNEKRSVAVLSPYKQQVFLLNDRLSKTALQEQLQFRQLASRHKNGSLGRVRGGGAAQSSLGQFAERRVCAYTVDAFQGNEADIVIISLVRNNKEGPPLGVGFVRDAHRLNVLISRGAKLLVLVGSWAFFQKQVQHTGLPDYRKLADLMRELEEMRKSGKLLIVPAERI